MPAQGFSPSPHTKLFQQLTQHVARVWGCLTPVGYQPMKWLVPSCWAHLQFHPWDTTLDSWVVERAAAPGPTMVGTGEGRVKEELGWAVPSPGVAANLALCFSWRLTSLS